MNSETPAAALADVAQKMRGHNRRRAFRLIRDTMIGLLLYATGIIVGSMSIIGVRGALEDTGELSGLGVVAVLFIWVLWLSIFVRTRWPWVPIVAGAICAVIGADVILLLIGVFHGVVRLRRTSSIVATAVGTVLVIWAVVWACFRNPAHNPFSILFLSADQSLLTENTSTVSPQTVLAVDVVTVVSGVIGWGVAVGVGYLVRRTRTMRSVEAVAVHQTERSEALSEELARQSERQMLARELHDTLSHRLSVISLHSGALEVAGGSGANVAEAAAALRREAKASLDDLRDLVSGVRDGSTGAARSMADGIPPIALASLKTLPELIDSVRATGTQVGAVIVLEDVERAPTVLGRAAYRIIQESLTNAMKHAPGAPITVDVRVSANDGARLMVANPVPSQSAPALIRHRPGAVMSEHAGGTTPGYGSDGGEPAQVAAHSSHPRTIDLAGSGGGMGLLGIKERVRMLHGEVAAGVRGDAFVVDVRLPAFADRVAPD